MVLDPIIAEQHSDMKANKVALRAAGHHHTHV